MEVGLECEGEETHGSGSDLWRMSLKYVRYFKHIRQMETPKASRSVRGPTMGHAYC